jgi:hypothetical protein
MIELLPYGSLSPTRTFQVSPLETITIGSVPVVVSMQEIKTALPVYDNQSQTYLGTLLPSAQRRVEDYIGQDTSVRQRQSLWTLPAREIRLPYGKHVVELVEQYIGEEWVEVTDYKIIGLEFLSIRLDKLYPTRVTYQSGGGYPADMKAAIIAEVSWHFKNRNDPNEVSAPVKSGLSEPARNILSGL